MRDTQEKRRVHRRVRRRRTHGRRGLRRQLLFILLLLPTIGVMTYAIRAITPGRAAALYPMAEVQPPETQPAQETSAVSADDWQLLLVNPWNPVPEDYAVELTELKNGQAVDARAYPDLQRMMDDCRAAGLEPVICSSYRTQETQQRLYENKIRCLMDTGLPREEAAAQAGTVVAVPGTSEHQTGLALDIVDASYQVLDSAQESTAVQQWLMEHSWEYGFVLRYPNEKSEATGIIYEPWHYRYVGCDAAREMRELGLCLEEYLDWLQEAER